MIHPPTSFTFPPDPQEFLLPLLLIWHPALTYTHIFENQSLECPHETCNKKSVLKGWNDEHVAHHIQRTIHDVNDVVCAIYACEDGHRILAHDAQVLKMITSPSLVPFVLLHQTGFTKEFVDLCTSMCQNGMIFHSLEAVIGKTRLHYHIGRKQKYESIVQQLI